MKENFKQLLISGDQFLFCLVSFLLSLFNHNVNVYADLTLSAQAYRLSEKGYWYGKALRWFIDLLFRPFEKEHCKQAYQSEMDKGHLPDDLKNDEASKK